MQRVADMVRRHAGQFNMSFEEAYQFTKKYLEDMEAAGSIYEIRHHGLLYGWRFGERCQCVRKSSGR